MMAGGWDRSRLGRVVRDDMAFFVASTLFAIIISFIRFGGDDLNNIRAVSGRTVMEIWQLSVRAYQTWSSRTIVNFIPSIFFNMPMVFFAAFMGISMFVLLKALALLFVKKGHGECNYFIACFVMMFPFGHFSTAGWVAAIGTYFSPVAFGLMSLVPIKKIYHGESFRWWEYIFYALCLVYGANIEQMMVVILACYLAAAIWFLFDRKPKLYCGVLLALSICSCLYTILCPGNFARQDKEIPKWFQTYRMLDFIDKVDLGVFTTLKWLFFDNNLFIIFSCILLAILIWKKYTEKPIRLISLLPVLLTLGLGPFKPITVLLYPNIGSMATIPYEGLVTAANRGGIGAFIQYMVLGAATVAIAIEIFLLSYSYAQLASSLVLLGAGFASRVAMGFSPTVYASSVRTFDVMGFCIVAAVTLTYCRCTDHGVLTSTARKKMFYVLGVSALLFLLNLCFYIELRFK